LSFASSCPACGFLNEGSEKFCGGCGRSLNSTAATTEPRFASPQSYTPKHLAERILTSKASLEGERKLVTVLFVDVAGFTALSERLDPEDVHQLMDRAFELMLGEIHRYEGTVNQFLGDGLMALFGAPIAHEDHSQRAIYAALAMRRTLGTYREELRQERSIDFQVRMGLNTGPVVVGKIGDNLRMDYTAVGDTTNLAARLQSLAEPGQILVSEDIARVAGPYFILHALGETRVKGKALPVRPYSVEATRAARSRLEAVMERGLTPLVGRERELALLEDRLAEACVGRGQVVFVFGEAGIGKSRLLVEFRRRAEAHGVQWLTGRCVSYGRSMSYLPVLDLVRSLFGIQEADGVDAVVERVQAGVRALGEDLRWTVPFLRALLACDPGDSSVAVMPPHQRRGRIVDAVSAALLRRGEREPLVIMVEDLHWTDPHSEEVLRALLDAIATAPVMIVLAHRPGYSPPFGDRTYHSRITLHSLPASETAALVARTLQAEEVPGPAVELIARRAEGNPLFVEELSRALVENGTLVREDGGYRLTQAPSEIVVPDTVQGVIMARIDRLPEEQKTALQIASVIGREFTARLVERISDMAAQAVPVLGELRAVELIYQKATYPELTYLFKHAFTHDVAYESLLRQRRRSLHRRAGAVIEELYAERLPEFYEALAWHFGQGEDRARAADYQLKAARKARAHYAYRQAIQRCEETLGITGQDPGLAETRSEALELLGDLESLLGNVDRANEAYDSVLGLVDQPASQRRVANKRHRPGVAVRAGARIVYYEHGSGSPTLLLAHPLFYGLGTYQPFLEELCQEFRVITVDPRGTGRSDPIPEDYRIRDHVEDIRTVAEAVGDTPLVFVGISAAGLIGVNLAAAYPHLVKKLITVGSPPAPMAAPDFPIPLGQAGREFRARLKELLEAGAYEKAMALFWAREVSEPGDRDLVAEFCANSRTVAPEVFRTFFLLPDPARDVRPLLPTLRTPTLVLHGDADQLVPVEVASYIAAQVPGALLYIFKGRGHALYATATTEFVRVARSFIRSGQLP
jgi:class 3 adenylate cyclase/pimeloyl-ACP methyl ester carboxylesterase